MRENRPVKSPYIHLTHTGRVLVAAGMIGLLLTAAASDAGSLTAAQIVGLIALEALIMGIGMTRRAQTTRPPAARKGMVQNARTKKERPGCCNSQGRKE